MNAKMQSVTICYLLMANLLLAACGPKDELGGPTILPTPIHTLTPIPILISTPALIPTLVSTSTTTLDPMIVKGFAFADSILVAIANHPPDYQDNFSNPKSGWNVGLLPLAKPGWGLGETGYDNGEYFIETPPGFHNQAESALLPHLYDLVIEVDARFISAGQTGDYQFHIRHGSYSSGFCDYMIIIDYSGRLEVILNGTGGKILSQVRKPSIKSGDKANHIQIFAQGTQIAVSVNDDLVAYVDNLTCNQKGRFNIVSGNNDEYMPQRVQFDNLMIWDISKLKTTP